jgi:hypothetical protein
MQLSQLIPPTKKATIRRIKMSTISKQLTKWLQAKRSKRFILKLLVSSGAIRVSGRGALN